MDHKPIEGAIVMTFFRTESVNGKYYLFPGSDTYKGDKDKMREVQQEEIGDALPYGISDSLAVVRLYAKRLKQIGMF